MGILQNKGEMRMITLTPAAKEEINRAIAKYDNEKYVRLNMGVG